MNGYWTCCTESSFLAIGCHDDTHDSVSWPDEKAKIYFVEKQHLVTILEIVLSDICSSKESRGRERSETCDIRKDFIAFDYLQDN